MRMNIYIPDALAEQVKTELAEANISAICQAALQAEMDRAKARTVINAEGYARHEVYDSEKGRYVAFQGRQIGRSDSPEEVAWLTANGAIAVYSYGHEELRVYDDFSELADPPGVVIGKNEVLITQVADALGETYTEELDI